LVALGRCASDGMNTNQNAVYFGNRKDPVIPENYTAEYQ
jgi:hypothetical protein